MYSEEEKKAIEWLKKATFFSERLYAPIILNLIEKQQKEIEALKIIHETYKEVVDKGDFISKDKIKEKIKELDSYIWKDGYMTKFDRYAKHYLNELLGE